VIDLEVFMGDNKIYLDREGYQEYLRELEKIKKELQENSFNKSSSYVDAVGDGWHDNFAFEESKRKELGIIRKLEEKLIGLSRIVILEKEDSNENVNIGDLVKLKIHYDLDDVEENIFRLIGGTLPDISAEIIEITLNSPIGTAIFKKKIGEKTFYMQERKKIDIEIISKIKSIDIVEEKIKTK
jgi:transcription elongation GreA/GreB family factor